MTSTSTSTTFDVEAPDESRIQAFAERLLGTYADGMATLMIDLGHRCGLFENLAASGGTSQEIAERAGATERYVREWLGAIVTAGIAEYDPVTRRYTLPVEHALCLSGPGSLNLAPMSRLVTLLAQHVTGVDRRHGPDLPRLLRRSADRGAPAARRGPAQPPGHGPPGRRHRVRHRPRDQPDGPRLFPLDVHRLRHRRRRDCWSARGSPPLGAAECGLEVCDVTGLPLQPPFDIVFAFDAVHDQVNPAGVLARVHEALRPGGQFLMFDVRASSALEENIGNPLAPLLYGFSTLHCTPVSLAGGGAGLGTMWGEQLALRMLAEAGFINVAVREVPEDPADSLYVAHKAG